MRMRSKLERTQSTPGPGSYGESPPPKSLLSPEVGCAASLLGLCFSGYIKSSPLLNWLPLDPTFLFALLCILSWAGYGIRRNELILKSMLPSVILWATFLPAAAIAGYLGFDPTKMIYLFSTSFLCVVMPSIIARSYSAQIVWIAGFGAIGMALGVGVFLFPDRMYFTSLGRIDIEGGTTIATSRVLGAVALLAFALIMVPTTRIYLRVILLLLAASAVIVMLLIGSRGPVISLALAVPLVVLTARLSTRARLFGLAGLGAMMVVLSRYVSNDQLDQGTARILEFLTGDLGDAGRLRLYDLAVTQSLNNPQGLGWSGFGELDLARGFYYPHNIFLEIFVEGGWIAGLAVIAYVVSAIVKLQRNSSRGLGLPYYGLAIYWLMASQFSSDINGNRMTWAAVAFGFAEFAGPMRGLGGGPREGRMEKFSASAAHRPFQSIRFTGSRVKREPFPAGHQSRNAVPSALYRHPHQALRTRPIENGPARMPARTDHG